MKVKVRRNLVYYGNIKRVLGRWRLMKVKIYLFFKGVCKDEE